MRIAHVLAQDPTRFRGGTEVVASAQARALAGFGHEVRVVAPCAAGDAARRQRIEGGVELVTLAPRTSHDPTVFVDALARDAVLAATRDADVVHVHQWYGSSLDLVRRLAVERVTVLHLHDAFSACARTFRAPEGGVDCPRGVELDPCARCIAPDFPALGAEGVRLLLEERRELLRAEFAAADAVVAPSRFLAELVASGLGVPTPRVVPHGLVAEVAPRRAPERSAGGPLRVLHPGNRAAVKGCLDLAEAVGDLPAGTVKVVFRGREVEAGLDAELARRGGPNVELHGAFEAHEWPGFAADHDLCALPSRAAEGYGLVAEEALAHGLPTWVSDRGALPERVHEAANAHRFAGRVVPAGDVRAWREALLELVESRAMLQDARRLVPRDHRDVLDSARDLEALDRSLLAADPRRTLRSA